MYPSGSPRAVRFGVFEADFKSGELRKEGKRIRLQEQPFQALRILLERPGDLVTREELRQRLWPDGTFVDFEDGLNTAIKKLRDALGDSAETPRYIETVPRKGYRFLVSVEPVGAQPRTGPRPVFIAALIAAVLVMAVAATRTTRHVAGDAPPIRAIAVLPLANLTGNPTQEYLGDGLTAALTTELAQLDSLRVISMTSAMKYKAAKKKAPQIARELRVDALVEGSVRASSDRLWVDVQLIDAKSDRHLWAKAYEQRPQDLSTLASTVTQDLAGKLETARRPAHVRGRPRRSVKPQAFEAYLLGRHYFNQGSDNAEVNIRARESFEQAIAMDPHFAEPYAGLAELYARGGRGLADPRVKWMRRSQAREHAEKALRLDPMLSEAHSALAWTEMLDWDYAGAEREFRRALQLDPNNSVAHIRYGEFLVVVHERIDGLEHVRIAQGLDPVSPLINIRAGITYFVADRREEARKYLRRALELDPTNAQVRVAAAQIDIVEEKFDEAIGALEAVVKDGDRAPLTLGTLAHAYGRAGNREAALTLLAEMKQRYASGTVPETGLAYGYVGLRDFDQAMSWLEKAYEERRNLYHIKTNPMLHPLQEDARFKDLLRRMGMPERKVS